MELSSPTNTSSATIKNEGEIETPTLIQPPIPLSFSNGVLKRRHHHRAVVVTYKECLKNHAATMGGHAVDGCGEFMPATNTNPNDPTSLKCAACGCHRNFHRRDPEDPTIPPPPPPPSNTIPALEYHPHHRHHPPPPPPLDPNSEDHSSPSSPSPPPISSSYYPPPPHMLLPLSSAGGVLPGGGGGFPGVPLVGNSQNSPPPHMLLSLTGGGEGVFSGGPAIANIKNYPSSGGFTSPESNPNSRKRFRTKFTQDQKEKMVEFGEKVGWKFQKKDEEIIIRTCNEIGIDKGVLKVWMHNNKNTLGKKDHNFSTENAKLNGNGNGNGNGFDGAEYHHHHHQLEEGDASNSNNDGRSLNQLHQLLSSTDGGVLGAHVVATTTANGSSS